MNRPLLVAVANQKGGVAKTTTAISLAHGLAVITGEVVNLVDLDQQGQCAIGLGMSPRSLIFDYLVGEAPLANCLQQTGRTGLALMPGNARTKHVDLIYRNEIDGFERLCTRLRAIAAAGHLVIDTPTAGLLQEAAIHIADVVVIPARCETLSIDSVHATLSLASRLNPAGRLVVLPTMFDKRLGEHNYNLGALRRLPSVVAAAPVPARVAVIEAASAGRTIWEHTDAGLLPVREAYANLLETITTTEAPA